MTKEINMSRSLDRPAWTSDNLHAYRNKYTIVNGKHVVLVDYYVKTGGLVK